MHPQYKQYAIITYVIPNVLLRIVLYRIHTMHRRRRDATRRLSRCVGVGRACELNSRRLGLRKIWKLNMFRWKQFCLVCLTSSV